MFENLMFYVDFVKSILLDCNVPFRNANVSIAKKSSTQWLGQCKRKNGVFSIVLNPALFQSQADDSIVVHVLLHEFIHTVNGCFNHGSNFKYYAGIINNKYHYDIARTTNATAFNVVMPTQNNKFEIVCNNCGAVWHYKRSTDFVQCVERDGGQRWTCGCGAKGQFKCIRLH